MQTVVQRAFAGGEIAPGLYARADQVKYATGLRTCRNFIVRREGGVSNRPGLRFVEEAKSATAGTKFMRFVPATGNGILIEMGQGYLRFFRDGAAIELTGVAAYGGATAYVPGDIVLEGGVNYYCIADSTGNTPPDAAFWYAMPVDGRLELPTSYALGALPKWNQSGNVLTLTHPSHPTRELAFETETRWTITALSTTPSIAPPSAGLGGVAGGAGTGTFAYVITSVKDDTYEESIASAVVTVATAADPTAAAPIVVSWTAVVGAAEYNVYGDPYGNGTFGYLGTATGSTGFNDAGFVPDFAVTPPIGRTMFGSTNNYPSTSCVHQQRLMLANTNVEPDSVFGSRTGFSHNFGITSPLQDDDAIQFRIAGNNNNPVHWLLSLKAGLVVLTGGGEWTVGLPGEALTPSNLPTDQDTYNGVHATVRPVVIGNSILYLQARGSVVRDLQFDQQIDGLGGKDLTVFASHLMKRGKTIVAMDFQQIPNSIVWAVRSDGVLLGLTYLRDQELWGWHRHDTAGDFEEVCVIPEDDEDVLYCLVSRTIDGDTVRYIERLESRVIREGFFDTDAFFVDSGLSYSGSEANTFSGLDHLEGELVAVVGDGAVVFNGDPTATNAEDFRVTGGAITTAALYSKVHLGLPIPRMEIETLDIDVQGSGVRDKAKRTGGLSVLLDESSRSFYAGPDSDSLLQVVVQEWEGTDDAFTGQLQVNLESSFNEYGRVIIRQTDPLPITVLGIMPSVEMGG